jgi:hypothetical protein
MAETIVSPNLAQNQRYEYSIKKIILLAGTATTSYPSAPSPDDEQCLRPTMAKATDFELDLRLIPKFGSKLYPNTLGNIEVFNYLGSNPCRFFASFFNYRG